LNGNGSSLHYAEVKPHVPFEVEGLRITAIPVNHTIPTVGLLIEDERSGVVITGDTYHTDAIWEAANRMKRLDAVFVDVSYPNELEELAADSKHLTPQALARELQKLHRPVQVRAVHIKPMQRERVVVQLAALRLPHVSVGIIGHEYQPGVVSGE
jgi:ribonuclease BN (tRNA processing enzyme)